MKHKLTKINCGCRKRWLSGKLDRMNYGTCYCDTFSGCDTQAIQLSNFLFEYINNAQRVIVRDDWDIIAQHAQAIKDYPEARFENQEIYLPARKKFEEAMAWYVKEYDGLWW